ncbi:RNA polymerase subunit sigma-70 [Frankia sp. CcI49]|uniref:sigma-70 family RNA polymerase sigma factor n=1 Tax=unclassified Frankia TaxID=2632575 RepID=UPI0006CA109C|nr:MULTISPECIES: sigma-70 family RNA polymerase sigma factor [unclassified Frankia]KPM54298.1 RNA polymerase sigma 70 [Frankia sp. R43]ONH61839.1 RNA polymerase subunit sigma-70 [Frankia sp. CcI49]
MTGLELLAERFGEQRPYLRSVAYRLLGSWDDADDAVQECWVRLSRSDVGEVLNLRAWLTTVTSRICLDMLRARASRREQSLDGDVPLDVHLPDPVVAPVTGADPEHEALLADAVGLALDVVLGTLSPPERIVYVLHDLFAVPMADIAVILGRTPAATKQLASRARQRVQGNALGGDRARQPATAADRTADHAVVQAFFTAARAGDFEGLLGLLAPEVIMRADGGSDRPSVTAVVRGAAAVARRALMFARPDAAVHPVLVDGAAGVVVTVAGTPLSVMGFAVRAGVIVAIDVLADPARLERLRLPDLPVT